MKFEEYAAKIRAINAEGDRKKLEVREAYSAARNTVGVGDVVRDTLGSIKVESIVHGVFSFGSKLPECQYYGTMLTQKGLPYKSGECRVVYQSNLRKVPS